MKLEFIKLNYIKNLGNLSFGKDMQYYAFELNLGLLKDQTDLIMRQFVIA